MRVWVSCMDLMLLHRTKFRVFTGKASQGTPCADRHRTSAAPQDGAKPCVGGTGKPRYLTCGKPGVRTRWWFARPVALRRQEMRRERPSCEKAKKGSQLMAKSGKRHMIYDHPKRVPPMVQILRCSKCRYMTSTCEGEPPLCRICRSKSQDAPAPAQTA